jgi:isoleucyl-tRNA synthetase
MDNENSTPERLSFYVEIEAVYFWSGVFVKRNSDLLQLDSYLCGTIEELPQDIRNRCTEVNEKQFNKAFGSRASFVHWALSAFYVNQKAMTPLYCQCGAAASA